MVFLIALLHIIPPVVGTYLFKEAGLKWGAICGCILAVTLGVINFVVPDLIGVGVGYFIGLGMLESGKTLNIKRHDKQNEPMSFSDKFYLTLFIIFFVIPASIYFIWGDKVLEDVFIACILFIAKPFIFIAEHF